MSADELVRQIVRATIEDPSVAARSWDAFALVAHIEEDDRGYSGFAYRADDPPRACTPAWDRIDDLFVAFREAMFTEGRSPTRWTACVMQLVAESGQVTLDFAYGDANPWDVSPATYEQLGELLRPGRQ